MRARGIEFELNSTGDGTRQVMLWGHALLGSMHQEEEAGIMPWSALGDGVRLVRWDARGHGGSEATLAAEDYTWSGLARDLWAIADGLELEKVVLGGVSMGAGTALHAALMAPERTAGLVLMAPPTAWESRARQARLYEKSATFVDWFGLGPVRLLGGLGGRMVRNRALGALQRSVIGGLKSADPRSIRAAFGGAAGSDLPKPELLEKLDVPTLILAWTSDWSHPLSTAEALRDQLSNSTLEVARNEQDVQGWPSRLAQFLREIR
jgi:pimeloyl-ACP methyl ester carboxylesterase